MPESLDHPYDDLRNGRWIRGSLHVHPRPKDSPWAAADRYAQLGYGFLGMTEHDYFYGPDEIAEWESRGVVLLPGCEVTRNGPHILQIGGRSAAEPQEDRQAVIDAITSEGGFAIVNHPNTGPDFNQCPVELLRQWTGYLGVEVFNASGLRGAGNACATDKWDMLLSGGRRLWAFAGDDHHRPIDAGRGWLQAFVRQRSVEGVLDALRSGRFYASTGVTINRIDVDGLFVRVEAADAHRIAAIREDGRRLASVDAHALEVHVPADATYVRFECWGQGEHRAWTQPFWPAEGT